MSIIQKILLAITIIGGINWGLVGIFDFDLVEWIFQGNTMGPRVIYSLVGITAVLNIALLFIRNHHKIADM